MPPLLNKDSLFLTYFLNETHLQNIDFCCEKVIHSYCLHDYIQSISLVVCADQVI